MSIWTASYDPSKNIYAIPFLVSNGNAIKTDGSSEAYNTSHLASYAVAYSGSGPHYSVAVPSSLPQGVSIDVVVMERLGGAPSVSDSVLGAFSGSFDGTDWATDGGSSGGDVWSSGQRDTVLAALAGSEVTLVGPHVDGDDIELISGDDYLSGRLAWSTELDLTGKTIMLSLVSQLGGETLNYAASFSTDLITVDITSDETSDLLVGANSYKYRLWYSTPETTLQLGYVTVTDGV